MTDALTLRCPQCDQTHHLICTATILIFVDSDGEISNAPNFHLFKDGFAACPDCDYKGRLQDFTDKPPDPTKAKARQELFLMPCSPTVH